MARLTHDPKTDMRTLHAQGHPVNALAEVFGVSPRTVYRVVNEEAPAPEQVAAARECLASLARARDDDSPTGRLLTELFGFPGQDRSLFPQSWQ
jgi:Helix-turn-helix domain of resolvase